jgi:hypothetical protein
MKRVILASILSLACGLVTFAQQSETSAATGAHQQTSAAVSKPGKHLELASGTRVTGELQNTIDVRRAKVGDQVILKTTEAIKSGGRTVVNKGSRLMGHVTEVAKTTKDNGESRLGILFDQLQSGSLALPITASISSITTVRAGARTTNDGTFAGDSRGNSGASSMGSAGSSAGGNAGLLGGVGGVVNSTTSTVGGVVGGTTSAVGTTVDASAGAVGNTTAGLGRSLSGIQISQSSNASVEGSSVLSLEGGNLRLEQGTNFNLVLTQSAHAGTAKDQ